ncbi:hypothetical protein [Caballeronia sp. 15715]|uniref:hypothetical protein n=1 Tax=unclassified Caballeronia TaxID=2646786 RepID=UPI0039E63A14
MLARLTAYSSETSLGGVLIWRFNIEVLELDNPIIMETLSLDAVASIADIRQNGPITRLCRAIRNANEGDYQALLGVEFGAD